jgi:hypothetical protein
LLTVINQNGLEENTGVQDGVGLTLWSVLVSADNTLSASFFLSTGTSFFFTIYAFVFAIMVAKSLVTGTRYVAA